MIERIISGGQTGVDIAALRAAKARGIETGGTMPKGFRTLVGPRPDWAREFRLTEHASDKYPPRTYQNVRDSDLTIRIAWALNSAGERCAALGLWTRDSLIFGAVEKIEEVRTMLGRGVAVNFAGNSEKTAPGIEAFAEGVVKMIIDAACGGAS